MGKILARQIDGNDRQVELSFSSEEPYTRWFGVEVLSHDEGAVDLTRLNEIGVLLFNHGRDVKFGGIPVGKVISAELDSSESRCRALVEFDTDDDADAVYQKVKSGTLKGVSVGYSVDSWEEVVAGKTSSNGKVTGPAYVALKWQPYEISIVSIPADPTVGVGRSIEEPESAPVLDGAENKTKSLEDNMEEENKVVNEKELREDAQKQERQRVVDINSLCREFDVDGLKYIEEGLNVDQVRAAILEKMKVDRKPSAAGIEVTKDSGDKLRAAGSDAILLRAGLRVEKPSEGALEMRGMSLRDMAIECLVSQGLSGAHRMDNDTLFREALTGQGAFSALLDNTVNKTMRQGYNSAPSTFESFTAKGSAKDFRASKRYQISEAGELEEIKENGEFRHDEMKDIGSEASIATFGKQFSITRQALINDDISILTKVPAAYVRAAKRGINKLVYKTLGSNPSMPDGVQLFHANHKNLAGTGASIGVAPIGAGRQAMRTQKNLRGMEVLNIGPSFLIVPASLETVAETFLNSIADPSNANANVKNIFANKLQLVVDAELDQYSATSWYLAADSMDCETIEVTYLNGNDAPTLESQVSFDTLGMKWRIFIDYGVNLIDHRGLYKNTGA